MKHILAAKLAIFCRSYFSPDEYLTFILCLISLHVTVSTLCCISEFYLNMASVVFLVKIQVQTSPGYGKMFILNV